MRVFIPAAAILLAYLTAAPAQAQGGAEIPAIRTDTPSGLPVPRFVGLKYDKTHCRRGPSFDQPVVYTFYRAGLPVMVVAETTDHWRKIRDKTGGECWAHQTTLRASSHAIVERDIELYARARDTAAVRARLSAGVIAAVEREAGRWRLLRVGAVRGWARSADLWGVTSPDMDSAAHN